jgi:hypothetical protein
MHTHFLRLLLLSFLGLAGSLLAESEPELLDHVEEGVYTLKGAQVRPDRNRVAFQTTILELKDGQFRYWFQSDAKFGEEPVYPQTGKYAVEGGKVTVTIKTATLKGSAGGPPRDFFRTEVWQFMKYQGKTVLWPTKLLGPPKGGAPPHNVLFRTARDPEEIWKSEK